MHDFYLGILLGTLIGVPLAYWTFKNTPAIRRLRGQEVTMPPKIDAVYNGIFCLMLIPFMVVFALHIPAKAIGELANTAIAAMLLIMFAVYTPVIIYQYEHSE